MFPSVHHALSCQKQECCRILLDHEKSVKLPYTERKPNHYIAHQKTFECRNIKSASSKSTPVFEPITQPETVGLRLGWFENGQLPQTISCRVPPEKKKKRKENKNNSVHLSEASKVSGRYLLAIAWEQKSPRCTDKSYVFLRVHTCALYRSR